MLVIWAVSRWSVCVRVKKCRTTLSIIGCMATWMMNQTWNMEPWSTSGTLATYMSEIVVIMISIVLTRSRCRNSCTPFSMRLMICYWWVNRLHTVPRKDWWDWRSWSPRLWWCTTNRICWCGWEKRWRGFIFYHLHGQWYYLVWWEKEDFFNEEGSDFSVLPQLVWIRIRIRIKWPWPKAADIKRPPKMGSNFFFLN